MNKFICFVAGHSGGHIIPCATQAFSEIKNKDTKIIFFSTNSQLDEKILSNYPYLHKKVLLPIRNVTFKPLKLIKFIFDFYISFFKSIYFLYKFKPQKVVSMGGIVSLPVCFAAKLLRIPIELWELNVEPGKAVNLLSKLTSSINICFQETAKYFKNKKCNLVSYPIRFKSSDSYNKENILSTLGFQAKRKTIFILGGSQGSQFVNCVIKDFIIQNTQNSNLQIIHQTGNDAFDWHEFYKKHNVPACIFSFNNNIDNLYFVSDLIVCRSGSGTLAEVLFFKKKCITIPLETSYTSHQKLNALALEKKHPELIHVILQKPNSFDYIKKIDELIS